MDTGKWLADDGLVTVVQQDTVYRVKSENSPPAGYEVICANGDKWTCSCKYFQLKSQDCKHIAAAQLIKDRARRAKILSQPTKSARLLVAPRP